MAKYFSDDDYTEFYASPGAILCGELFRESGGSSGVSANVVLTSLDGLRMMMSLSSESGVYAETGHSYMSLDGLVRPISLHGGGGLPGFTTYYGSGYESGPSYTMPPMNVEGSGVNQLRIDSQYLNPLMNPTDLAHDGDTPQSGHDFVLLNRDTDQHLCIQDSAITGGEADYRYDYRLLALRGPLLLTGWGHDTDGKPIPNAIDEEGFEPEEGFEGLQDTFLPNWLQRSDKWATGPVDLRFDRRRGVWVAPQPPSLVIGKLTEPLFHSGSASARLIFGKTIYDADGSGHEAGNTDKAPVFDVRGRVNRYFPSGTEFVANYDTQDQQYYIITTSKPLYLLTNCADGGDTIYSDLNELADHAATGDGSGIEDIVRVDVATGDEYAPLQRKCYQISVLTEQPPDCYTITCIEPIEYFDDCEKCNPYWILETCPTGEGSTKKKTSEDMEEYDEMVIKVDIDEECYYIYRQELVDTPPEEEGGPSGSELQPASSGIDTMSTFEVTESYEDCDECKGCYKLEICPDQDEEAEPVLYITDNLRELTGEDTPEDVITADVWVKVSGICYEVAEWSTPCITVSDSHLVGLTEDHIYDSCSGCSSLYRWTQNCTPEECAQEDPNENEEQDNEVDDIVTTGDYASSVGKWRKSNGLVYEIQLDPVATTDDEDFRSDVESTGPYDTCQEALDAPIDGTITPLRKITITDENVPRWHINKFIFNTDGKLTGLCPTIVKAEGSEC